MQNQLITPSLCADREDLLEVEHIDAALIRIAEATGAFPIGEVQEFLKSQRARLRHEAICPDCTRAA